MFPTHTSFALIAISTLAIFGFGGAHFPIYVIVSILLSVLLPYCAYEFSYRPSKKIIILATLFYILPLILFFPYDSSSHQTYFPSVSKHIEFSFALTQIETYPLLIRPYGAIKGLIYTHIYMAAFLIGCIFFQRTYHVRKFSYLLCHVGFVFCILGYIQRIFNAPTIYWISGIPSFMRELFFSTYSNPSHAGYFLAFLTPLALSLAKRYALFYGFLFSATIFYTQSRGALLAWAIGLAIYFVLRYRYAFFKYVISGIILLTGFFFTYINYQHSGSLQKFSSGRFDIWSTGFEILSQSSWLALFLGHGGNSFVDLYTVYKKTNTFATTYRFHQEFLEWIVEFGLFHFFIMIFFVIAGLYNIFQQYQDHTPRKAKYKLSLLSSISTILIGCCLDIILHIPSIGLLCFLGLGCGFAKQGTKEIRSWLYLLPFSLFSLTTCILFIVVQNGDSIYASPKHVQERAELAYTQGDYDSSKKLLIHSIQTAPVYDRSLRIYNQIPGSDFGKYTAEVIARAPNNANTYISAARIAMLQGNKIQAWTYWHQALSLQVSDNNSSESLVAEALQIDPQIALFYAIPIENERLNNTINVMIEKELIQEALFFTEGFYDLSTEIQFLYAKLLFIDGQCKKAWQFHLPAVDCSTSKLESKIATCLESNSSQYHRKTIGLCGGNPKFELEYLKAQLREGLSTGIPQALQLLKEKPKSHDIRRLLIHCFILNKEPQDAQVHLRYLINMGVASKTEIKDLKLLRNRKPTEHYPLSFIQLEDPQ